MNTRREPVTHEDLATSIALILQKQETMATAQLTQANAQIALANSIQDLKNSVAPLVQDAATLRGVAEVTRAAGIWRKFFVGALGLLVLIAAAGGVVAGVVLGVKQWIIEGVGE